MGREMAGVAGGRIGIWLCGFPATSYLASLCLGLLICGMGTPGVVGSLHDSSRWPPLPGIHTLCCPSHTGSTAWCDQENMAQGWCVTFKDYVTKDSSFHLNLSLSTPGPPVHSSIFNHLLWRKPAVWHAVRTCKQPSEEAGWSRSRPVSPGLAAGGCSPGRHLD